MGSRCFSFVWFSTGSRQGLALTVRAEARCAVFSFVGQISRRCVTGWVLWSQSVSHEMRTELFVKACEIRGSSILPLRAWLACGWAVK